MGKRGRGEERGKERGGEGRTGMVVVVVVLGLCFPENWRGEVNGGAWSSTQKSQASFSRPQF